MMQTQRHETSIRNVSSLSVLHLIIFRSFDPVFRCRMETRLESARDALSVCLNVCVCVDGVSLLLLLL